MLIDILFLGTMLTAVYKGVRNGLIIAIFSIAGWIIGLMAALKFSDLAAEHLKGMIQVGPGWLSTLSFFLVFIAVMLLVRLGAKILEKTIELGMMGWINRLGGVFFYVLLYTLIFSVIIHFAEKVKLFNEETISSSLVYKWVKPIARFAQLPFLH